MKPLHRAMLLFLLPALAGAVVAEDLSHYVTPSGFQFPLLQRGEYILSTQGVLNGSGSESIAQDEVGYGGISTFKYRLGSFSGMIAVTDELLIRGVLDVYPSQTRNDITYRYTDTFSNPVTESRRYKAEWQLRPSLTMAYRPLPRLEIYAWGIYSTVTTDVSYGYVPRPADDRRLEEDYYSLYIGMTYLGKL